MAHLSGATAGGSRHRTSEAGRQPVAEQSFAYGDSETAAGEHGLSAGDVDGWHRPKMARAARECESAACSSFKRLRFRSGAIHRQTERGFRATSRAANFPYSTAARPKWFRLRRIGPLPAARVDQCPASRSAMECVLVRSDGYAASAKL